MQKITDKDFDNKFRQALDEMEVMPPKDLFAKIEKEIHQKKNKRMPFYVAAASIAAILAIGIVWQMQLSTKNVAPKIANNLPQKTEKITTVPPVKNVQPQINLTAKTSEENRIKKAEKNLRKNILHTSNTKHYNEPVAIIKKQEPKIIAEKNMVVQQNIPEKKTANENIALTQTNVAKSPATVEQANKLSASQAIETMPKANDNKALAISEENEDAQPQRKKNKFISGLFKNLKQKVTDITNDVVSSDNSSTTVNLGFVAITKYKN